MLTALLAAAAGFASGRGAAGIEHITEPTLVLSKAAEQKTTVWINRWLSFQRSQSSLASADRVDYMHRADRAGSSSESPGDFLPATLAQQVQQQEERVLELKNCLAALEIPPLCNHPAKDDAAMYLRNSIRAADQSLSVMRRVVAERGPDSPPVKLVDESVSVWQDKADQDLALIF